MMLVSVPKASSSELQNAVKGMEGMSTTCFVTDDPHAVSSPGTGCKFSISLIVMCVFLCLLICIH